MHQCALFEVVVNWMSLPWTKVTIGVQLHVLLKRIALIAHASKLLAISGEILWVHL